MNGRRVVGIADEIDAVENISRDAAITLGRRYNRQPGDATGQAGGVNDEIEIGGIKDRRGAAQSDLVCRRAGRHTNLQLAARVEDGRGDAGQRERVDTA